jgi:signal peptidase I
MEKTMFISRVTGQSMEPKIPDGSWVLFRYFETGSTPSATTLDGRRVVVQLRDATDPETGGRYTLKRWKVSRIRADGSVEQIELHPDNSDFKVKRYTAADGDIRVVAEFLEVVA